MAKRGKIYKANAQKVDPSKKYSLDKAFQLIESFQNRKFDENIEVAFNLGVDPKHSDQMVRGATALPHGLGKKVRVVAIVSGEAEKEAREAGADHIGHKDLIEKIQGGWLDFDRVLATPETTRDLAKVARILGPRGLMPNKKSGTVTDEIGKAVKEQKLGKVAYKVEKTGIIHAAIGKKSFGVAKLKENFMALYDSIAKQKPSTSKGVYLRKISLSPNMGPSVNLDPGQVESAAKEG